MILVIADLDSWSRIGRPAPDLDGFRFASFPDLDAALLQGSEPDLVLSVLIGRCFDALDLAQRLSELGYAGRYRALAEAMPGAGIVREEIRAAAPGLDFDILEIRSGQFPRG